MSDVARLTNGQNGQLAVVRPNGAIAHVDDLDDTRLAALKRTYFKGLNDAELEVAIAVVKRTGLSPEAKQIYFIKRYDAETKGQVMQPQISIDGFRLIAERTGKYAGQVGPFWCGPDGIWTDVWLSDGAPAAAKVGVINRDFREPVFAVARFSSYAQKTRDGGLTKTWASMPDVMIAKCAESLALRKAFPQELTGLTIGVEGGDDGPPVDERLLAMRRMNGLADEIGIGHDLIKPFVAETTKRPLASLGSTKDWSVDQLNYVTDLINDRGRAWVHQRTAATITLADSPPVGPSDRRALRPGEFIDPETGEIVPAEDEERDAQFAFPINVDDRHGGGQDGDQWTR